MLVQKAKYWFKMLQLHTNVEMHNSIVIHEEKGSLYTDLR